MIEIILRGKNANGTVYVNKKRHYSSLLKRKQRKFYKKLFVVTEFVKTCDELVIGQLWGF